jgi:hypothetical protein
VRLKWQSQDTLLDVITTPVLFDASGFVPKVEVKGTNPVSRSRAGSCGLDAGARRPAPCLRACGLNSDGLLPPHSAGAEKVAGASGRVATHLTTWPSVKSDRLLPPFRLRSASTRSSSEFPTSKLSNYAVEGNRSILQTGPCREIGGEPWCEVLDPPALLVVCDQRASHLTTGA